MFVQPLGKERANMKAPETPQQRPTEVWAGTRMSLDVTTQDGAAVEADIWIEVSTGEMRLMEVRPAGSDLEAFAQSLWNAVSNPVEGEPYRPGNVVVDRTDLAKSLATMARFQKIEVDVDPSLSEQFDQLKEDLEGEFRGDFGFTYLGHHDVEADLVEQFFRAAPAFFADKPWEQMEEHPWLEVAGLSPAPVYVSVVGDEESPGVLLCWDIETAENISRGSLERMLQTDCLSLSLSEPDGIGDELKEEIESHDWPVTTKGVPLLVRPARPERVAPTSSEMTLMLRILENLPRHFQSAKSESTFDIADSGLVTVRQAVGNFEFAGSEEERLDEVLEELDGLEAKQQWPVACALALTFQEEHKLLDERLLMKTTSYLHHLGSADSLEEFTEAIGSEAPPAWPYVSAWAALAQGHKPTFRKRLKKAVKGRPEIGKALLEGTEAGDDPFLKSWAAIWRNEPAAMDELRALLEL